VNDGKYVHDFDGHLALFLAVMSYQAYEISEADMFTLPQGYSLIHAIRSSAGEVFGFIAESADTIVVAFRGTATLRNVNSYLDISQIQYPFVKNSGKTHRGITHLYIAARYPIMNEINRLSPDKRLFVTGHSLGGGLAALFALDAAVNTKFQNPILYTFASLPIGDQCFTKRFYKEVKHSIRIMNINDTVTNRMTPFLFKKEPLINQLVGQEIVLNFQKCSTTLNHKILCYYHALSKIFPRFAKDMRKKNPGFCPNPSVCE
jgi:triacylglycerol lipase